MKGRWEMERELMKSRSMRNDIGVHSPKSVAIQGHRQAYHPMLRFPMESGRERSKLRAKRARMMLNVTITLPSATHCEIRRVSRAGVNANWHFEAIRLESLFRNLSNVPWICTYACIFVPHVYADTVCEIAKRRATYLEV